MKFKKSSLRSARNFIAGLAAVVLSSFNSANAQPVNEYNFAERNRANVSAGAFYSENSGAFAKAYVPVKERGCLDGRVNASTNMQAMVGMGYNKLSKDEDSIMGANIFGDFGYVNGFGVGGDYLRNNFSLHGNLYVGKNDETSHIAGDIEGVAYLYNGEKSRLGIFAGAGLIKPEEASMEYNFKVGGMFERNFWRNWSALVSAEYNSSEIYDNKGFSAELGITYSFGEKTGENKYQPIRRKQPHAHIKAEKVLAPVVVSSGKNKSEEGKSSSEKGDDPVTPNNDDCGNVTINREGDNGMQ